MREIKFRAYVKDRMQYSGQLSTSEFNNWHEVLSQGIFPESPILMQFTGLKDKNGKEIYEGDIFGHRTFDGVMNTIKGEVVWEERLAQYEVADGLLLWALRKDAEVIGNVYENPELLKETNG